MSKQDIDLQKMQILESSYQGLFNFRASLITGTLVGVLILLATLQFENILPPWGMVVGYTIALVFGFITLHDMSQNHSKHICFMDELIAKIEKEERLGDIESLREEHKEETKKKQSNYKTYNWKALEAGGKASKVGDYLFVIITLILAFLPFVVILTNHIDLNKDVAFSNLNGLITAVGIFVGFITASVVSRTKEMNSNIFSLMRFTVLIFTASIITLSLDLILRETATILDVTLFSSTLILAAITAWNIMHTLYKKVSQDSPNPIIED